MFVLEDDRKKSSSWAKVEIESERLQAHSFFAYSVFSDVMVHTIAGMAIIAPLLGLLPSLFPGAIQIVEGDPPPILTWALSGLLALIGAAVLYGHRAAPVEHFLTYDPVAKTFDATAFNRKGVRVSQSTLRAVDVATVFLVDDEGRRTLKQAHPSTDVWLKIVVGKKTKTLLSGREADIWPAYQRMRELTSSARASSPQNSPAP